MVIEIQKAEYLVDYKIKFTFSDNKERIVDFESFLKKAKNPATRKYLELYNFRNFHLEYGDIVWGDHEMCFPIWDLYQGQLN
ncbi:MAG: DUF2442 domain-containing protein [Flavobacteriales bacterium]